jgi:hypothetical protein
MSEEPKYLINQNGINKNLYNLLKKHKVKGVMLKFSGGHDEGFLDMFLEYRREGDDKIYNTAHCYDNPTIIEDIKNIVYDAAMYGFQYSGAGDGTDYGDDYYFDLDTGVIRHEEWYMVEYSNTLPEKKMQMLE